MKRSLALFAVLALSAVGAVSAYQAVARQRDYRKLLGRGDTALREDQTFAAIEAYSGAIALRGDSMLAYLRRGETYQRRGDRGDLDAAARDFRKAASLDPSATHPLESLGDVLYQVQRYGNAADRRGFNATVARHDHVHLVAEPDQRSRQRAEHVGKTARFCKRHCL